RAPGRVSLAGGGTDVPAFYERHGGAVVSAAIPMLASASVGPCAAGLDLVSLDHGSRELIPVDKVATRVRFPFLAEEFLTLQKAVAWHFALDRSRLATASELPGGGGLGSSAAVCVGLVAAAAAYLGEPLDRNGIAEIAARIEMTVLRRPCGKQDQYTAAYGGLNLLEFGRDGVVRLTPIRLTKETARSLGAHLMLFTNGARRNSAGPLSELTRRIAVDDVETLSSLSALKANAYDTRAALEAGDVERFGVLLDEGWKAKRRLHSQVSTPEIDRALALAKRAGAYGGKLTGAGLAGSLFVVAPPGEHAVIRSVLRALGWQARDIAIEQSGVTVGDAAEGALSG
ncbi:MAG: hypothetical protein ACRDKG_10460, partial [Actinomycetota bacterium]